MSIYGSQVGIKKLEKELAEKESRFKRLNDDSLLESLFLTENEFKFASPAGPVWKDLHLRRNALINQQFAP